MQFFKYVCRNEISFTFAARSLHTTYHERRRDWPYDALAT